MITLGLGLLLAEAANSASWLTGGADGLQGVRMWKLFGVFQFDLYGTPPTPIRSSCCSLLFLVARRLINSPFGLALARHSRECHPHARDRRAEPRAYPQGLHHRRGRWPASPARLLAQTTETVSLETLSFQRSADVLVILILGGAGRLYGGIVGAIIYMVARDQFSGINPQYWYFWIGTLLVAVVIFLPNGILGGAGTARALRAGAEREQPRRCRHAGLDKSFGSLVVAKRHRARSPAGRALRADRAERRRQDHADQPDHRHAQAGQGPDLSRRGGDHRARAR